jgi:hypothetical protein
MVALVGSVEDALQDSNHHSKEWTPVVRNCFIKNDRNLGNKGLGNFEISNHIGRE